MRNSASPKTSAYTVEELSRMESQMKVLEDRYDTIQKRLREALKQESGGLCYWIVLVKVVVVVN